MGENTGVWGKNSQLGGKKPTNISRPVLQRLDPWHLSCWFSLFNRLHRRSGSQWRWNVQGNQAIIFLDIKSIFFYAHWYLLFVPNIMGIYVYFTGGGVCVCVYRHINASLCRLGKTEIAKVNRLSALQHGVHWGQWLISLLRKILNILKY